MAISSGFSTSSIDTIEETEMLPSLMLSAAMWEWQSMMPGITYWPAASMSCAPGGTSTFSPASTILPSRITTEPWNAALGDRQDVGVLNDDRRARGEQRDRAQPNRRISALHGFFSSRGSGAGSNFTPSTKTYFTSVFS